MENVMGMEKRVFAIFCEMLNQCKNIAFLVTGNIYFQRGIEVGILAIFTGIQLPDGKHNALMNSVFLTEKFKLMCS